MDPRDDYAVFRSIVESIERNDIVIRKKMGVNSITHKKNGFTRGTKTDVSKTVTFEDQKAQHKGVFDNEES